MRKFHFVDRILKLKDDDVDGPVCMKRPKRSTKNSAGYDFFAIENVVCKSHEITLIPTGIKAEFPSDEVLLLFNRSSNPKKKGLIIPNGVGVIDSDYYNNEDNEGEIGVLFYNMLDEDVEIKCGEKMMQGVFTKFNIVDDDNAEGQRTSGFGSTGK